MGRFAGTLDSIKSSAGSSRGARSRAAPENKATTTTPPVPTSDSNPSTGEASVRASPEPSRLSPAPQQDKGKQPAKEPSNKRRQVDEDVDAPPEVQEGSILADARRKARRGCYVSFNPMTETKGRVTNIEEAFKNLPCHICLMMQYMNESITTEEWGLLNQRKGIEILNHTMLLTYKLSPFLFLFLLYFYSPDD